MKEPTNSKPPTSMRNKKSKPTTELVSEEIKKELQLFQKFDLPAPTLLFGVPLKEN